MPKQYESSRRQGGGEQRISIRGDERVKTARKLGLALMGMRVKREGKNGVGSANLTRERNISCNIHAVLRNFRSFSHFHTQTVGYIHIYIYEKRKGRERGRERKIVSILFMDITLKESGEGKSRKRERKTYREESEMNGTAE